MTTLLAIDTATEACSAALLHGDRLFHRFEIIPRMHAQRLLPMVDELLTESGVILDELDALVFGRGPGAFTGVRIATGMVQGLAFASGKPVIAVSNLAALAQRGWREQGAERVCAAIDARMDEVYWGCFRLVEGVMQPVSEEVVCSPERVSVPDGFEPQFGCGTGWSYVDRLAVKVPATGADYLPDARDLIDLALPAWRSGATLDAADAQPIYLRDQVATPKGR